MDDETIKTSMTLEEFKLFMVAVNESLERAIEAKETDDKLKSSEIWRKIFGEEFPLYGEEEIEEIATKSHEVALGKVDHADPLPWSLKLSGKVRIDAYVYLNGINSKSNGINSNGKTLGSGWNLKYIARTSVRGNYEVFWQVVNTGPHAKQCECLRGGLFEAKLLNGKPSSDPLINWEQTKYTGKHWIQCFIIQNESCVARSKKFYVKIKNPEF